jgi:hypothetical protein
MYKIVCKVQVDSNFQAALYDIANRPVRNIANRAVYLCIRVIGIKKISTVIKSVTTKIFTIFLWWSLGATLV